MNKTIALLLSFATVITISIGCSHTEKTTRKSPSSTTKGKTETSNENNAGSALVQMLDQNRSHLSDLYQSQNQDLPEEFLKKDTSQTTNRDPFDGYRIQIISTHDVSLADSIASQYRMWADSSFVGYTPKSYIFFKQPFYKVHIGDFHTQSRAYKVTNILKSKYPEAWVVHDRINPLMAPSDTARIALKKDTNRPGKKGH